MQTAINNIMRNSLTKNTIAAPLAAFRILFGLLMLISLIRFWYNGWIEKLYLEPHFHFKYFGFEFIQVPGIWTYPLFIFCSLCCILITIGYRYHWAMLCFFLSFTYIELMDKTTYLNHYYFISSLSFLLLFLPLSCSYSLDAYLNPSKHFDKVPLWTINVIKLFVGIVYIYAGAAKINSDWLFNAMPLKIWLPSKYGIPLIGDLLQQPFVHYLFSWSGMIYDLLIVFFLLNARTRIPAFMVVLVFHIMTRLLFPIGMFPFIMISAALIFFSPETHKKVLDFLFKLLSIKIQPSVSRIWQYKNGLTKRVTPTLLIAFFAFQLLFPLRNYLYPGNLFWTEQGYRFSWRVMLMEKAGYAQFKVVDSLSGKRFYINNSDFLTSFQEKQMATQPDFILEYAHYLGEHFKKDGHQNMQIFVESFVALNGRTSRPYINPEINLLEIKPSLKNKDWILPYEEN